MKAIEFSIGILLLTAYTADAGPFGIEVDGFTLEKYACESTSGLFYKCSNIPLPHNEFEMYGVRYHPDVGVCTIKAIGRDISNDGFGTSTKNKVDEIYNQVSPKYGEIEKADFLLPSSIWNEADEWLMGIVKNERIYAYIGDVSPAVEGIKEYGVMATASSSDTGYVTVEFLTINSEKCDVAESKDGASSF